MKSQDSFLMAVISKKDMTMVVFLLEIMKLILQRSTSKSASIELLRLTQTAKYLSIQPIKYSSGAKEQVLFLQRNASMGRLRIYILTLTLHNTGMKTSQRDLLMMQTSIWRRTLLTVITRFLTRELLLRQRMVCHEPSSSSVSNSFLELT